ncbi:MAG TPA: M20/M25/M40 family metallo-hydrolase [Aggregatilineaceae bacterium]|nr:M20/M25/M40 family metallo-hydrolase [Aggregatilineaceae bacterium]
MFRRRTVIALLVSASLLLPVSGVVAQQAPDFAATITAENVMAHIKALSVDIGTRPAGSEAETRAADYIAGKFRAWGYEVEVQEFEFEAPPVEGEASAEPGTSRNVIARRTGDDQVVVVGAHMDSVTEGTGADDNASGVAAMLAAAEALKDVEPVHTMVFVAFGSEEIGDLGADEYVKSLGDDIQKVVAMLNIDTVGAGTSTNVYAGATITWPEDENAAPTIEGGPTWVRDLALSLAGTMNLTFGTTPADTWGGFTGDWSDHYPFVLAGVPVAYFEAWQWTGAENPWWGQETAQGDVLHTAQDVYDVVVPEKVETVAELVSATTYAIATSATLPPAG